jgi:uncharacterized DUF497 family protein
VERSGSKGAAMVEVVWDLEDDPKGNVQHIAEHGVTPEEVEEVLNDPASETARSRSSDRPMTFGYTAAGRPIVVVWEMVEQDPLVVYPITAYEPEEE